MKDDYTDPKTKLGTITANNPMDLLCIGFTKVDPSKSSKENILVLTDAYTKFCQVFVTPNLEGAYHSRNIGGQVVLHIWYSHMNS